eukprot:1388428-Pyramimonas_sp.AAC.1
MGDLGFSQAFLKSASKRKGAPRWSLPVELWGLGVGGPPEEDPRRCAGLGSELPLFWGEKVRSWLHRVFS